MSILFWTLSCPVEVEGNTGVVDNVVETTYHFDVLNNDQSQLTKEGVASANL